MNIYKTQTTDVLRGGRSQQLSMAMQPTRRESSKEALTMNMSLDWEPGDLALLPQSWLSRAVG